MQGEILKDTMHKHTPKWMVNRTIVRDFCSINNIDESKLKSIQTKEASKIHLTSEVWPSKIITSELGICRG